MNRHVNAIAGRLSLRAPQRESLEILDRITEIAPPQKGGDIAAALDAILSEYPSVTDFEREFPSLCFALATGVGKTRLMGAFIAYLHLAHGLNNFFVLAPNLTIYNKLIADFTPNTPKYVFKGISEFAVEPPDIITGDSYEKGAKLPGIAGIVRINIFNISKINSEVRGGKSPRIKRLSEYIGESYFEYLSKLPDLVLLMDESHRYRASAGAKAINDLKPVLGLELTATPYVETSRGNTDFRNIIYDYSLAKAMADGFVKEPAVVTRKDFNPAGMSAGEIEILKLEDGVRVHESVKVELETYARETGNVIVKPFMLIICRDTTHASQLLQRIQSEEFFSGRYAHKVIQVDSSSVSGAEGDGVIERLLKVESADEPTEIVIHVNMLKEGWDVTNLYTIVPLRAANAKILIEQSIGRGLRLPYGKRTGVAAVDRLNIIAHDKFQEIIEEANKPGSAIRLQTIVLTSDDLQQRQATFISQPKILTQLGIQPEQIGGSATVAGANESLLFQTPQEQAVARIAYDAIRKMEKRPETVPGAFALQKPEIQAEIVKEVRAQYRPAQLELEGTTPEIDFEAVVAKTTEGVVRQTIDIPRVRVVPQGEVRSGFHPFTLELGALNYPVPDDTIWVQYMRTNEVEMLQTHAGGVEESRLEDYIVSGLVDFDDVSYDDHADLLYDLATQTVNHIRAYLSEEDTRKVLRVNKRPIVRLIHAQMQSRYWENVAGYDVIVIPKFTPLKECNYTASATEPPLNFRTPPADKNAIKRYLFGGFERCLYTVQKFDSDAERRLAVILERESQKWFRPVRGQFEIYYKREGENPEYQPDFVAETSDAIYMLEPKRKDEMDDSVVLAKRDAAVTWCQHASDYALQHGLKPWKYVLIPHDSIDANRTLAGLAQEFS